MVLIMEGKYVCNGVWTEFKAKRAQTTGTNAVVEPNGTLSIEGWSGSSELGATRRFVEFRPIPNDRQQTAERVYATCISASAAPLITIIDNQCQISQTSLRWARGRFTDRLPNDIRLLGGWTVYACNKYCKFSNYQKYVHEDLPRKDTARKIR